jgi:uncharacterized membrane protein YcgQ (UPF0703/DUF1980 family)
MDKQIQVTPENVGEWIVKNPQTALCIFKKGMEYQNKRYTGFGYSWVTPEYYTPDVRQRYSISNNTQPQQQEETPIQRQQRINREQQEATREYLNGYSWYGSDLVRWYNEHYR